MEFNRNALKLAMAEKCLTIAELSKKSGIGSDTIAKILNSDRMPNISTIGKLAKALGIQPKGLMRGE